jgi:hypothetical protein
MRRLLTEKLVFALLVMGGYIVVLVVALIEEPPAASLDLIKSVLLVIGPIVGMVAHSILQDRGPREPP